MYKSSEFTKGFYKTGEVLELLDISYDKFRYYDKTNRIKIKRSEKENYLKSSELILDELLKEYDLQDKVSIKCLPDKEEPNLVQ